MKTRLLAFLLALSISATAFAQDRPAAYDLQCEAMTSPLGIDSPDPHFSWKCREVQKTWRVQVASGEELLTSGRADLWDSGEQAGSTSVMVPYAGKQLHSRQLCWWRVCVNGQWSEPERFSIGIIGDDSMGGEYIGALPGESPILYTTFTVRDASRTTFLHINSLGYHEAYINGQRVSESVLAPAVSQLDKRSRIVTYDITPLLHKGQNDIAVWMGRGWYIKDSFYGAAYDGPLLKACVDAQSGGAWNTILTTDSSWKGVSSGYSYIGVWNHGGFGGERIDAGAVPTHLSAAALDRMSPVKVTSVEVSGVEATPQMCPYNILKETVSAVSVEPWELGEGWLVDMGKVMNAQTELHLRGCHPGDSLKIYYIDNMYCKNLDDDWGPDMIVCTGDGEQDVFRSKFNHHVFRYIVIEGVCDRPAQQDVLGHRFGAIRRKGGSFHSSDQDLNRIHDMLAYTMDNLVFSGYMVDCASIERLGYGGDGNASTLSLQTISDVAPVFLNWLEAWEDTIGEDGHLRHVAPSPCNAGGGPYWCSFIVQAPWRTYMSYADRRPMERHYDAMLKWISYVDKYTVDGLLKQWPNDATRNWYLGDWLAPKGTDVTLEESVDLVANCVVSQSYGELIRMASLLGHEDDSRMFRERKISLDSLIHSTFYHADKGIYGTGSQLDMIYPMLVGAVPQDLVPSVKAKLFERTRDVYDGHLSVGLVGVPVLAEWAAREREADFVYGMLKQRSYPGYLYMLDNGATATWEDWDEGARSKLHNCYNGMESWFYQALGGLVQDEPGFSHVTIAPQYPEGLDWVRVSKDTPYGTIYVRWDRLESGIALHVDIPAGVTATVSGREVTAGSYDFDIR